MKYIKIVSLFTLYVSQITLDLIELLRSQVQGRFLMRSLKFAINSRCFSLLLSTDDSLGSSSTFPNDWPLAVAGDSVDIFETT